MNRSLSNLARAVALALLLWQPAPYMVCAQDPAQPEVSGPVDIQANEQEFVGDTVNAKGNVHVKYKDTLIIAPQATLLRNGGGSPQSAVFIGHPRLIQGKNTIDAEKLTFDIVHHNILAEGNAHSEVISSDSDDDQPIASGKGGKPAAAKLAAAKPATVERIITDADRQAYDQEADSFEASGHVRVLHGDIKVTSNKLKLVYGSNKKPETALFNGNVLALQGKNTTQSDDMTYSLTTRRLQATGHVRSKVIQEKSQADTNVSKPVALNNSPDAAQAATTHSAAPVKPDIIYIVSDSQDYSKETGRTAADGDVHVQYQDMVGLGPQAILVRNSEGKAEKVIFIGRSQINQPGKRWIADHIVMTLADKKVFATGNTKSLIVQNMSRGQNNMFGSGTLAGQPKTNTAISASKVETPQ